MERSSTEPLHSCWLEPAEVVQTVAPFEHTEIVGVSPDALGLSASAVAYAVTPLPITVVQSCGGLPTTLAELDRGTSLLRVFPNPVRCGNDISGMVCSGSVLQLLDAHGRTVERSERVTGQGTCMFRFSTNGLSAGLYLLRACHAVNGTAIATTQVMLE